MFGSARRSNRYPKGRDNGIYLGELCLDGIKGEKLGEEVRWPGTVHGITIGPNNSGKSTRFGIPNIADLKRSIFVVDVKGEMLAISGRARAKLGRVLVINPFNVLADKLPHLKSHGYNPLSAIDESSDDFTDDCTNVSVGIVKEEPGSNGAFFGGSAQDFTCCGVMQEKLTKGEHATLAGVRSLLTQPLSPTGLIQTIAEMTQSPCESLRDKAGRFASGSRSNMDVIATAINETRFLDSPRIRRDLAGPGFDWNLTKQEIVSAFLVIPADRLESHANYLRLIVTSALRTLLRSPPSPTLPPVLLLLDEFAALGYLPPVENAAGIARGFGVQLWPILQDLNQLKALYRDRWQTFVGNAGIVTAFAPRDLFTAQYLSDLCGKKVRNVRSRSMTDQGHINWTDTPHELPRFRPEDLMRMPAGQMLCIASDVPLPFFTAAKGYWETSYGRGLDPNPYFRPQR